MMTSNYQTVVIGYLKLINILEWSWASLQGLWHKLRQWYASTGSSSKPSENLRRAHHLTTEKCSDTSVFTERNFNKLYQLGFMDSDVLIKGLVKESLFQAQWIWALHITKFSTRLRAANFSSCTIDTVDISRIQYIYTSWFSLVLLWF